MEQHAKLLPPGNALDVAAGEGRNAIFLAKLGYDVLAIDVSKVGLAKSERWAAEAGVEIQTRVQDLEAESDWSSVTFNVIVISYYLQRSIVPKLKLALKPGGMILAETFNTGHSRYKPNFPSEFMLRRNELIDLFGDLEVLRYQAVDNGSSKSYSSILVRRPVDE